MKIINTYKNKFYKISIFVLVLLAFISQANSARIKDIAQVEGSGAIQVIGYGLVVGLNQTGDNQMNAYTNQSVINMLKRFGISTDNKSSRNRNVAAVMVTATIPNASKRGSKIDVTVSSLGDATSLQGGNLLLTPLSTAEGQIIGNAQGPLSVGGYDFSSQGSRVGKNFVTTGRVPNGLIMSENISNPISENNIVRISLREPDFTSVTNMAQAINRLAGLANSANAIDAATVEVTLPTGSTQAQALATISRIENLDIQINPQARVVINERTGTIVVGGNVQLLPAVIAHGGLEISIQKQVIVPQPAPFTILPPRIGETAEVEANEEVTPSVGLQIDQPTTIDAMAEALNTLNVKPRDLIAIFQALKEAGALQAELIIQ